MLSTPCSLAKSLLSSVYSHVVILGAAPIVIQQHAGIPCIATAVATALAEAQLASNDRHMSAAIRDRTESAAARASQLQTRALRMAVLVWLEPSTLHRRFLELIATELADLAGGSPA